MAENWEVYKWINVEKEKPIIPKDKNGIIVLVTVYDEVFAEASGGHGKHVETMIWDGEYFTTLIYSKFRNGEFNPYPEFSISDLPITHWMYPPLPMVD